MGRRLLPLRLLCSLTPSLPLPTLSPHKILEWTPLKNPESATVRDCDPDNSTVTLVAHDIWMPTEDMSSNSKI